MFVVCRKSNLDLSSLFPVLKLPAGKMKGGWKGNKIWDTTVWSICYNFTWSIISWTWNHPRLQHALVWTLMIQIWSFTKLDSLRNLLLACDLVSVSRNVRVLQILLDFAKFCHQKIRVSAVEFPDANFLQLKTEEILFFWENKGKSEGNWGAVELSCWLADSRVPHSNRLNTWSR